MTRKVVSAVELKGCIEVLESIAADSLLLSQLSKEDRVRLLVAAGQAIRPDQYEVRRRVKAIRKAKNEARRAVDKQVRSTTSIRAARTQAVFVPPPRLIGENGATGTESTAKHLENPDACYICKSDFTLVHHFYDSLCPSCADLNYEKRFQSHSLDGRVALITGARLKIGFQAALMLLRAGAHVIVTTRFPRDAAGRFSVEADFENWQSRLDIFGLDLRHSPSVEAFTTYVSHRYDRLDFLVNNAAQTVRRPPGFYAHLLEAEQQPESALDPRSRRLLANYEECKRFVARTDVASLPDTGTSWVSEWHADSSGTAPGICTAAQLSQIPYACDDLSQPLSEIFPVGKLDADMQQVDLRRMNSWRMTLADVPTAEMLEVQLINSIAPFILCSKLKPLMLRHPSRDKHIVNVSAMEGKFSRRTKTDKHPHTNMAKAALNMMTLTSARDYVKDGIFMNAVDTGWVTDEDPAELSARKQKDHDFQPPLDIVDGAARVLDPIFTGLRSGEHSWGNFLKDYAPTDW